jgi:hypothetical protein
MIPDFWNGFIAGISVGITLTAMLINKILKDNERDEVN